MRSYSRFHWSIGDEKCREWNASLSGGGGGGGGGAGRGGADAVGHGDGDICLSKIIAMGSDD